MRRRTKTVRKGKNYSIQSWRGLKGKNNEFIVNIFIKYIDLNNEWVDKLYSLFGGGGNVVPCDFAWSAWRYDTLQEAEQVVSVAKLKNLL